MNLPTLAEMDALRRGQPIAKPEPRRRTKGRKDRAEAKQVRAVRAACVERDGPCRMVYRNIDPVRRDLVERSALAFSCAGPSQWAHLHDRRRSKTRGMAPALRHSTAHSLMLCAQHHALYDAKRLTITARSCRGADGPLRFSLQETRLTARNAVET